MKWADIEEIVCSIAPPAIGIVAEPRAPRLHPATTYQAQFSLPFAVATAVVGGRSGLDLFGAEALADRRVLALASRVTHRVDPALDFPRTFGGRVTVSLRDGRVRSRETQGQGEGQARPPHAIDSSIRMRASTGGWVLNRADESMPDDFSGFTM